MDIGYPSIYVLCICFEVNLCLQSTWKLGLRNSFKNIRRGLQKEVQPTDDGPPPKRRRVDHRDDDEEITQDEYDGIVQNLKGIMVNTILMGDFAYFFRRIQKPRKEKWKSV